MGGIDFDDLTAKEQEAVMKMKKLAMTWPRTLSLFSNSGTLEIHKNGKGEPYTEDSLVGEIYGIKNDGGDRY